MNNIRKHRNNKFLVIRKNSYLSFMVECDMMNIENRYIWTIKIARFFMNREKIRRIIAKNDPCIVFREKSNAKSLADQSLGCFIIPQG